MPPIEVILNAASGTDGHNDTASQLKSYFSTHGIEIRIHEARSGEELSNFARKAASSEAEIVVAGGGDGTIGSVAAHIVDSGKMLGVLPLGTLNHFAKDLQIPPDLDAAVNLIANRRALNIDVGEVNGRVFINNSSLGLYPDVVRGRELRQRLGFGKWHSLMRSAFSVFRRYPLLGVRLIADGKDLAARVPFVFIGNNEYQIESFDIGGRKRLNQGNLSVYMARRSGRLALLRIAIRAVVGGLSQEKDFLSANTCEMLVKTHRRRIRVAIDGEVLMMETPLRYRIRPGALRVIVPENYGQSKSNGDSAK